MLCQTIGVKYNIGYTTPICMNRTMERFNNVDDKCYSITLFESDGILLCRNEKEKLPPYSQNTKVINIFFHPSLLNSILSFRYIDSNILSNASNERLEDQDIYLLRPFILRDKRYQGRLSLSNDAYNAILRLFLNLSMELTEQTDIYWPCRSRSYLLELLVLIGREIDWQSNLSYNIDEEQQKPLYIEELLQYIHNNYTEKITLDILATKFATNRTTINQRIHKYTGYSAIDYIIHLRMTLACIMLKNTRIPISEVMYRSGFNDNSNFWRTFKKHQNMSPKEYRELYCVIPL